MGGGGKAQLWLWLRFILIYPLVTALIKLFMSSTQFLQTHILSYGLLSSLCLIYSCESDFHSKEEAKLNEVMDSVLNIGQTCLPSWAYHAFQRSNHNLVSLLFIFVFLTFNYQAKNQSLTGLSFVKLFLTTEIIICI